MVEICGNEEYEDGECSEILVHAIVGSDFDSLEAIVFKVERGGRNLTCSMVWPKGCQTKSVYTMILKKIQNSMSTDVKRVCRRTSMDFRWSGPYARRRLSHRCGIRPLPAIANTFLGPVGRESSLVREVIRIVDVMAFCRWRRGRDR